MRKGYRLSSFNAYSNYQIYRQVNEANFGGMAGAWDNFATAGQNAWKGAKEAFEPAMQGVNQVASTVGNSVTKPVRQGLGNRMSGAGKQIAESGINQAAATPDELAKLAALQKRKANAGAAAKTLADNRQGIGYGALGLGALGVGGAGLAAANAMGQKPQQY